MRRIEKLKISSRLVYEVSGPWPQNVMFPRDPAEWHGYSIHFMSEGRLYVAVGDDGRWYRVFAESDHSWLCELETCELAVAA